MLWDQKSWQYHNKNQAPDFYISKYTPHCHFHFKDPFNNDRSPLSASFIHGHIMTCHITWCPRPGVRPETGLWPASGRRPPLVSSLANYPWLRAEFSETEPGSSCHLPGSLLCLTPLMSSLQIPRKRTLHLIGFRIKVSKYPFEFDTRPQMSKVGAEGKYVNKVRNGKEEDLVFFLSWYTRA